jgi:hypothetical protein
MCINCRNVPAILEKLKNDLMAKGKSEESAWAIATASLQKAGILQKGTQKLTPKGKRRQRQLKLQASQDALQTVLADLTELSEAAKKTRFVLTPITQTPLRLAPIGLQLNWTPLQRLKLDT